MRDQSLKTLTENVFVLSLLWWIWGSSRKSLLSRPWSHRSLVSLSLTTAVVKFMPFLPFAWALFISLKLLRLFLCNSKYHYDVLRCGHLKFALLGPRQSLSLRVDLTQLMWSSPLLGSFWWIVGATRSLTWWGLATPSQLPCRSQWAQTSNSLPHGQIFIKQKCANNRHKTVQTT